jgi:DNA-binding NtrC family response regulator
MQRKTILLLEDEPIIRLDFHQALTDKGFEVNSFSKGSEAIKSIESNPPDLGILDIIVQNGNTGLDVAGKLKGLNIPFIFVSAFSNPMNRQRAAALEPNYMFKKPVSFQEVFKVIEKVIAGKGTPPRFSET